MSLIDQHSRPLKNLRLSVTDRCNLRCQYCMPEENYAWFPQEKILTFEESSKLVDVFLGLGVDKIRLTGGEPLLRRDLHELVAMLAAKPGVKDLALTTNAVLLEEQIGALKDSGLGRITISLDTLQKDRFKALSKRDDFDRVMRGIASVKSHGMTAGFKLDTVAMSGVNGDELSDLIEFASDVEAEVRFIEFMDVGGATTWSKDKVMTRQQMLESLEARYGKIESLAKKDAAPANQYQLRDGRVFGIIASTTRPFCGTCDRSRLTADGKWFLCLYAALGFDLKKPLREGASTQEISDLIRSTWLHRNDKGAEDRLKMVERSALANADEMKKNPHLEMHTRGG